MSKKIRQAAVASVLVVTRICIEKGLADKNDQAQN
jgi:hypothetical protein